MTKMTYVQALTNAISTLDPVTMSETIHRLTELKESIEKRNSAERKPTKAQRENNELREKILSFITNAHTATEVAEEFDISNQRATALLTSLVKTEVVERFVEKRKAYFKAIV